MENNKSMLRTQNELILWVMALAYGALVIVSETKNVQWIVFFRTAVNQQMKHYGLREM